MLVTLKQTKEILVRQETENIKMQRLQEWWQEDADNRKWTKRLIPNI